LLALQVRRRVSEKRNQALAAQIVMPLVGVGVPVQLPHLPGFDDHQPARHRLGRRELVNRGEPEAAAIEIAHRPIIAQQAELMRRFTGPGRLERILGRKNGPRLDVGFSFGKASKTSFGTPNSFASMSFGVRSIQSVMEKVPCSEKAPLSNDKMK